MILRTPEDFKMLLNYRINLVIDVMRIHRRMGLFDGDNARKLYPKRVLKNDCFNTIFRSTREVLVSDPKKTAMLFLSLTRGVLNEYSYEYTRDKVLNEGDWSYPQLYWSWWLSSQNSNIGVVRKIKAGFSGITWDAAAKF